MAQKKTAKKTGKKEIRADLFAILSGFCFILALQIARE
jgi:hypothetical protein